MTYPDPPIIPRPNFRSLEFSIKSALSFRKEATIETLFALAWDSINQWYDREVQTFLNSLAQKEVVVENTTWVCPGCGLQIEKRNKQ